MTYRLPLVLAALALACNVKTDLTDTASDTLDNTSSSSDGGGTSLPDTMGHSQTSASPPTSDPTVPDPTNPGQTVTTASPSEPGTISATVTGPDTEGSATDGDPSATTFSTDVTITADPDTSSSGTQPCIDVLDQPQNAPCTDASGCGCASDHCFVVPALGGFCGECNADADCPDGGCTLPNPVAGVGAVCNLGQAGDGCQTDAVCKDPAAPHCAVVLEVPGIITTATCGGCKTDADCSPQAPHCTPDYEIGEFSGQHSCKPAGSVPNNFGCAFDGTGDQACASGHCGEASVMGLLKLGICGECNSDADCGGGLCTDPAVDLDNNTLIGSVCM